MTSVGHPRPTGSWRPSCTDVGSTEQAGRLGDRRWRELLDVHDELARRRV